MEGLINDSMLITPMVITVTCCDRRAEPWRSVAVCWGNVLTVAVKYKYEEKSLEGF